MPTALRVGVVGYNHDDFDTLRALELLAAAFDQVAADHSGASNVQVITRQADERGIPGLARKAARLRGWIAREANIDSGIDNWQPHADVLVRIGGGSRSLGDVVDFRRNRGRVYEFDL